MENQLLSQVVTRLPPFTLKGQFSPITPHTLSREKARSVKPVIPQSRILEILNTQHTCVHVVWNHLALGGIPTLQSTSPTKP